LRRFARAKALAALATQLARWRVLTPLAALASVDDRAGVHRWRCAVSSIGAHGCAWSYGVWRMVMRCARSKQQNGNNVALKHIPQWDAVDAMYGTVAQCLTLASAVAAV
jgi:hypothetical protein